ncbi:hypothetical protein [Magnetospirillum sp. UT-4]|nr:hypothetical protein [Magnetospirillum sp. UT-4]CAA7620402.1 exported hypothetical protein [Magnetospirillum sp. UT-4]
MTDLFFEDLRRIVLTLLFLVAFGWVAAQMLPGPAEAADLPSVHGGFIRT